MPRELPRSASRRSARRSSAKPKPCATTRFYSLTSSWASSTGRLRSAQRWSNLRAPIAVPRRSERARKNPSPLLARGLCGERQIERKGFARLDRRARRDRLITTRRDRIVGDSAGNFIEREVPRVVAGGREHGVQRHDGAANQGVGRGIEDRAADGRVTCGGGQGIVVAALRP